MLEPRFVPTLPRVQRRQQRVGRPGLEKRKALALRDARSGADLLRRRGVDELIVLRVEAARRVAVPVNAQPLMSLTEERRSFKSNRW